MFIPLPRLPGGENSRGPQQGKTFHQAGDEKVHFFARPERENAGV